MTDIKDKIHNITTTVLNKLGIKHDGIEEKEIAGQTLYCIKSEDSGLLIGQRGDAIRALNILVSHLLENETNERHRITIDVNDYKFSKIEEITKMAQMHANRAKDLRYDVELQPLNGYERMLVHAHLADDTELETGSIGE
ncbi:MAG: KH domain-containing protein, partial [Candidatus Pacebacteria bacterium]|nr:KH domain-containing protein [Candidatus Paceibacterota bacterium]